jgi:hypothetical protein
MVLEGTSEAQGFARRSGRSAGGLKIKNPACAAVKREAEENCTKSPA